jgi:mannose-1-phosphate guanylyltransferase/phosphomannomutase
MITDFHKTKKGIGTVYLYHKDEISQSGVAVMDDENRIVQFIEKPGPGKVTSNLVNTGIYMFETRILDFIPQNQFSDFGKDIFVKVINAGENLYGVVSDRNLIAVDTPELLKKAMKG